MDTAGLVWFLAIVAGTTLLGLAFAYAVSQWNRRDRRLDSLREAVTLQNYSAEDRKAREGEP